MPNEIDINKDPKNILGQLMQTSMDMIKAEEAEKVMRKYLKTYAEKTPPEVLLQTILKGKATETKLEQTEEASQPKEQKLTDSGSTQKKSGGGDTLRRLLMAVGSKVEAFGQAGLQALGGTDDNKPVTPESQVATIQKTQELMKKSGIEGTVGATATGAPTISAQPGLEGLDGLSEDEKVQVIQLSKELGGVRGLRFVVPVVARRMKSGGTIDEIRDELRFSQQSPEFTGTIRNAAQQLTVGQPKATAQRTFDSLDDYLKDGDKDGAKEYMKGVARDKTDVTNRQSIMGQERTLEFLGKIKNDLQALEDEGFDTTGYFTGKADKILANVGQIKSPVHMELATRISLAVINFRRAMTGVQFGMKEHAEYERLFPGIDKVNSLNMANLDGLMSTFKGNTRKFYQQSMGEGNYNKLFGVSSKEIAPGYSSDEWEVVNE